MERVSNIKFLGTHISQDLIWAVNTSVLVATVLSEVTEESQRIPGTAAVFLSVLCGEHHCA